MVCGNTVMVRHKVVTNSAKNFFFMKTSPLSFACRCTKKASRADFICPGASFTSFRLIFYSTSFPSENTQRFPAR